MTENVLERLRARQPCPRRSRRPADRDRARPDRGRPATRAAHAAGMALGAAPDTRCGSPRSPWWSFALVFAGHGARPLDSGLPSASAGLPGVVFAPGAYVAPGHEIVSVAQCSPCQTSGPGQVEHYWTLVSRDGGGSLERGKTASGHGRRRRRAVQHRQPRPFDQHNDVWAIGSRRTRSGGSPSTRLSARTAACAGRESQVPASGLRRRHLRRRQRSLGDLRRLLPGQRMRRG